LLAEKYIPQGSKGYQSLSNIFNSFDNFFSLNPERWFGIWAIVVAGDNVVSHFNDRWMYWNWSSLSVYLCILLIIAPLVDYFYNSKYSDLKKVRSVSQAGKIFIFGFMLFIIGANPTSLSPDLIYFGLPYVLFFLVGHLTWGISINDEDFNLKSKKDMVIPLSIIILFSLMVTIIGFVNDDPMISTTAVVYLPFPLVALCFPVAKRHFQRCRIYVVFIPTMFLSMRYPWLLVLLCPLFIFLRHYYYFTTGKAYPTFKVDQSDENVV